MAGIIVRKFRWPAESHKEKKCHDNTCRNRATIRQAAGAPRGRLRPGVSASPGFRIRACRLRAIESAPGRALQGVIIEHFRDPVPIGMGAAEGLDPFFDRRLPGETNGG